MIDNGHTHSRYARTNWTIRRIRIVMVIGREMTGVADNNYNDDTVRLRTDQQVASEVTQ